MGSLGPDLSLSTSGALACVEQDSGQLVLIDHRLCEAAELDFGLALLAEHLEHGALGVAQLARAASAPRVKQAAGCSGVMSKESYTTSRKKAENSHGKSRAVKSILKVSRHRQQLYWIVNTQSQQI